MLLNSIQEGCARYQERERLFEEQRTYKEMLNKHTHREQIKMIARSTAAVP